MGGEMDQSVQQLFTPAIDPMGIQLGIPWEGKQLHPGIMYVHVSPPPLSVKNAYISGYHGSGTAWVFPNFATKRQPSR